VTTRRVGIVAVSAEGAALCYRTVCVEGALHIAEEVAEMAVQRGFTRLLLLGTRYLMEGPVYPAKLRARAIEFEIPPAQERQAINTVIFDELVNGRFEPAARSLFRDVIADGQRRGTDAAVLGCTEIPLVVSEADSPLPVLDSTRILARPALREAAGRSRDDA
jgi:aspartate racemase